MSAFDVVEDALDQCMPTALATLIQLARARQEVPCYT